MQFKMQKDKSTGQWDKDTAENFNCLPKIAEGKQPNANHLDEALTAIAQLAKHHRNVPEVAQLFPEKILHSIAAHKTAAQSDMKLGAAVLVGIATDDQKQLRTKPLEQLFKKLQDLKSKNDATASTKPATISAPEIRLDEPAMVILVAEAVKKTETLSPPKLVGPMEASEAVMPAVADIYMAMTSTPYPPVKVAMEVRKLLKLAAPQLDNSQLEKTVTVLMCSTGGDTTAPKYRAIQDLKELRSKPTSNHATMTAVSAMLDSFIANPDDVRAAISALAEIENSDLRDRLTLCVRSTLSQHTFAVRSRTIAAVLTMITPTIKPGGWTVNETVKLLSMDNPSRFTMTPEEPDSSTGGRTRAAAGAKRGRP